MKTAYQILSRPGRSAVIISTAFSALLVIFTGSSLMLHVGAEETAAIPLNVTFSLITIAVTLFPGLFFRFFSYARLADVTPTGADQDRLKVVSYIALAIESLNAVFLLNAYMAAITGGGVGTLGVLALAGFNVFWMAVWAVAALVLYFRRGAYIPRQETKKVF